MEENVSFEKVDFNPFEKFEIEKVAGLIDAQKEVWLSCVLGGEEANLSYNESISLEFKGKLNQNFFEKAIEEIVIRHEALRMTFSQDGNSILIYNYVEPAVFFNDLVGIDKAEQDEFIKATLFREATLPFDLQNGPLFRLTNIRLGTEHHLVIICAHHIICDGWSFGVILGDLSRIYNSYKKNIIPDLEPAFQFSQYYYEMTSYTQSEEYNKVESFWVEQHVSSLTQVDLPTDYPRPKDRLYQSSREDFFISENLIESIKTLGKRSNSSLVSTLIAAFEIFLFKISGQKELILGIPAAGQSATGHLELVGHCVNLLPLKTTVDPEISFLEYLKIRRTEVLDAYDHQMYTFGNLLKKLSIPRDPSRIPLVPVVFNIDLGMDQGVIFDELEYTLISNPRKFDSFELSLNIFNQGHKMIFEWSYLTQLFKEETIKRWMDLFNELLIQISHTPELIIQNILNPPVTNPDFRECHFLTPEILLPENNSFLDLFSSMVKLFPSNISVLSISKQIDYSQLDELSDRVAFFLKSIGVNKGDIIGVHLNRDIELHIALIGVLKSGCAYLPLDPTFPKERLSFMISNSGTQFLITEDEYLNRFGSEVIEFSVNQIKKETEMAEYDKFHPEISGDDLAYILYTSGSTGKPKGVQVTHLNFLNFLESMVERFNIVETDRMLAVTTVSFDISGFELFLPLSKGGSVYIAESEISKDGKLFLDLILKKNITIVQGTPVTWKILLSSGWDFPLNVKLLTGGEDLSKDLATKIFELVGPFWFGYGPTETTVISTIKKIIDPLNITIGQPIVNTQIYILDEHQNPIPLGAKGEIYIGGLGVSKGYLNNAELNNEKFSPIKFSKDLKGKMYRTGDLGRLLPNGEIAFLGRTDHQVKIRGYRIELGEIESILNSFDEIEESCVLVHGNEIEGKRLVSFIVNANPKKSENEDELIFKFRIRLAELLPDYMVPLEWVFIEKMPLTVTNKIDRNKLNEIPLEKNQEKPKISEPGNELEKIIFSIWAEALKSRFFGVKDNFFAIGGHSLMAVQIMVKLEKELSLKLPVNAIFKNPTISELASYISSENRNEDVSWNSLVSIKPVGSKPPLYIVHGAGCIVSIYFSLAENLKQDQPVYGFQPKGLNGIDSPSPSIEEMANHYINLMVENNPRGPYFLAGYSFGGYVAFEMARQMKERGMNIDRLIIFDTTTFEPPENLTFIKKVKLEIGKRTNDISFLFKEPKAFYESKQRSFIRKKDALLKLFDLKPKKDENENQLSIIKKITKNNVTILERYQLRPYDGEIYLFKVKNRPFYVEDKEYYGWLSFVKKVHVIDIPGHHYNIFTDQHLLKELAKNIEIILKIK